MGERRVLADASWVALAAADLVATLAAEAIAARGSFRLGVSGGRTPEAAYRLLASPEHARHLANVFDVMLMERLPDRYVPKAQWTEFLRTSFAANKPWDQLVREILASDGSDPATRPAARFYLDRDAEPHLLTRDISRLFEGLRVSESILLKNNLREVLFRKPA